MRSQCIVRAYKFREREVPAHLWLLYKDQTFRLKNLIRQLLSSWDKSGYMGVYLVEDAAETKSKHTKAKKLLIHFYTAGGGLRKMSTEGCVSSSDASRSLRLITDAFLAPWQPVRGESKEGVAGWGGRQTDGQERKRKKWRKEKMSNLVHWKWSWQET